MSIQEYIQHEIKSGIKHEFHDGKIFKIKNETLNHGLICGNVYSEIRNLLRKKESEYISLIRGVKLHIENTNSFVYPDSIVIQGAIEKSKLDENSVVNPKLIIEILSKLSGEYDRGDKFYLYRQIPSLEEYVMIEEERNIIDVYKKSGIDLWKITRYEGFLNKIKFESLEVKVNMKEIYFDVKNK